MSVTESSSRQVPIFVGIIAIVLLALGVGFLAGIFMRGSSTAGVAVGQQAAANGAGSAPALSEGHAAGHDASGTCIHELPPADAPVLAGLVCNCKEAACNQTPLLACHCATAHSIKDLTKQMIVEGTDKAKIPEELEKRWGSLRPTK